MRIRRLSIPRCLIRVSRSLTQRGMYALGAAFLLTGCGTMEKAAWIAGGGSAPLTVVEAQRSFARFVPVGQSSAKLRTELTLRETSEPLGIQVDVCSPDNPASVGLTVEPSDYGVALSLMAGQKGEFIPNGEYSNCKTDQGVRACARMKLSLKVSLCFNPKWQEDLKTKGEAVEVVPARLDLWWSCAGMGNCSWAQDGKLLADTRFILKKIPHRDEAAASTYREATRWKEAGYNDSAAKRWRDAGFAPEEATQWTTVSPEEAATWRKAGFSPADAKEWLGQGRTGSVDVARKWKQAGFTAEEAAEWISDDVEDPAKAKPGKRKGCRKTADAYEGKITSLVAMLNFTGGQMSVEQTRELCSGLLDCVKSCGKGKCGANLSMIADEKAFRRACERLIPSFRGDLLRAQ